MLLPLPPFAPAHGFRELSFALRSSHRTVPRVSPIIRVLGFAAAGNAGKASAAAAVSGLLKAEGLDMGRDGAGEGRGEDEEEEEAATHGVALTRPAPALLAEDAGINGNGLVAVELPQLPCLLTAERDDWAVELFSWRTR